MARPRLRGRADSRGTCRSRYFRYFAARRSRASYLPLHCIVHWRYIGAVVRVTSIPNRNVNLRFPPRPITYIHRDTETIRGAERRAIPRCFYSGLLTSYKATAVLPRTQASHIRDTVAHSSEVTLSGVRPYKRISYVKK